MVLIIVELTVIQLHTVSFELGYLCKNENGEGCAKVKTVHVNVDKKLGRKKISIKK